MSDQNPNQEAPSPAPGETRLTLAALTQRLNDYQTIFIERMQGFQEYIEGIETRHALKIMEHEQRIQALQAENEQLKDINNRLKSVERGLSTVIKRS